MHGGFAENLELKGCFFDVRVAVRQPQKKKASKSQPEKLGGETIAGISAYLITLG